MGLDLFPKDMSDELKGLAEKTSSSCAEKRFGTPGKADAAKIEAEQHFDNFKEKSEGLLSSASCDNIKDILAFGVKLGTLRTLASAITATPTETRHP